MILSTTKELRLHIPSNAIDEISSLQGILDNSEKDFLLDKLPKFNNDAVGGGMVFNCIDWMHDNRTPKIHPTQKPVPLLEYLIRIFTDPNDVVIDPCAGSGTTLFAAKELGRRAYGFEIKKEFFKAANERFYHNQFNQVYFK